MCDELVEEMEHYGQWSGGRHEVRGLDRGGGGPQEEGGGISLIEGKWNLESGNREGVPEQEKADRGHLCILSFHRAFKKYSLGRSLDTSP